MAFDRRFAKPAALHFRVTYVFLHIVDLAICQNNALLAASDRYSLSKLPELCKENLSPNGGGPGSAC